MYRAHELQRVCPRFRTWILQSFANGISRDSAMLAAKQPPTATRSLRTKTTTTVQLRLFSMTCSPLRQNAAPQGDESADDSGETPEEVVRRAKALFGDTLPHQYLKAEEYKLYERLYGTPLRTTRPEDVEFLFAGQAALDAAQADANAEPKHTLLRDAGDGLYEEVAYEQETKDEGKGGGVADANTDAREMEAYDDEAYENAEQDETGGRIDYIHAVARNQREFDALSKLQEDFAVAQDQATAAAATAETAAEETTAAKAGEEAPFEDEGEEEEEPEEYEEDEDDEWEDQEPGAVFAADGSRLVPQSRRLHPLTVAARARTRPTTVQLPRAELVAPIAELLKRTDLKHVRSTAEKALGGPGLPHSPATPNLRLGNVPQKALGLQATTRRMSEIEADAFMATVVPFVYASTMSTLVEVRRRLGPSWVRGLLHKRDGNNLRVLDAGGGGAALVAWNQVLRTELAALREASDSAEDRHDATTNGRARPATTAYAAGKQVERTVLVGNDALRHRASRFLHNTTFLPRLPDVTHVAENAVGQHLDAPREPRTRKTYDVILASHLLMPLAKDHQRRALIDNLWAQLNPAGGVLVVVEKAHPRAFEAVADARQHILDTYLLPPTSNGMHAATDATQNGDTDDRTASRRHRSTGMIVAPCTNHKKCPLYLTPGLTSGRKDFCHFRQRFLRPPFLQTIMEKSHRNNEDVQFSYVAIQRGHVESTLTDTAMEEVATAQDPMTATAPLVQGAAATDAAFSGYEHVGRNNDAALPPHPLSLPRLILPPIKRQGHVMLDVCTPAGQFERWSVPRSLSRQAFHDARKARWGDLWALGAKSRTGRPVRLGRAARQAEAAREAADTAVATAQGALLHGETAVVAGSVERVAEAAYAAAAAAEVSAQQEAQPRKLNAATRRARKKGRSQIVKMGLNRRGDLGATTKAMERGARRMDSDMQKLLQEVEEAVDDGKG